ncbi:hypothetical protein M378DRAFT_27259 [Amanita muscaria Koide BX008]|uniref:Protein kinase domain-containing protein n=1 Tax=Amanita muscaria (strain Koide BX008) TaxID=946122 RepID=A0A0C2WRN7_AMAMK|nr:hypothetical protein M378DRAFT_27259 [Amanita muscaria Koide BX008]
MSNLHDFLVVRSFHPLNLIILDRSVKTTDISLIEVASLKREWKPYHAVRDNTLVQKLCSTLENILGDTLLAADAENHLLARFSPRIQFNPLGFEDDDWRQNPSEVFSRRLLDKGVLQALTPCLWVYGGYHFQNILEQVADGGSSKVDYVLQVNHEDEVLVEAKSPSVMKRVGELLPPRGIELTWARRQTLVPKILVNAALYLGLRQMEWLFLTCHNYWIVCRLVRDDVHPFLAYSPMINIEDSSPSEFNPHMAFDTIVEGPSPEHDIYDGSEYSPTSEEEMANDPPNTAESGLMISSSSPNSPESFQVWMRLRPFSNNILALPQCADNGKRRLWLTRFVGFGSTGNVWQCRFDDSVDLFIAKIVEVLRHADADNRQRLRNEFKIYLTLEKAYQSSQLDDRIAPRCYGAFKGDGVDVLILDLCDGVLDEWGELSDPERSQIYKLVQDLHRIGIVHEDLEPRNIARTREGGFYLIDFSESRRHICKESKVSELGTQAASSQKHICSELQTLRNCLWKRQPLQDDRGRS